MAARLKVREVLVDQSVDDGRNLLSNCVGYITGLRGLGSMEYVSKLSLPSCLETKNSESLFNDCVRRVTGRVRYDNSIYWGSEQADGIAKCFNRSVTMALQGGG